MPRKTKIHASEINYFVLIAVTIGYCLLFSALWKFLVENNLIWLVPVLVIGGFVVRWYLKKKAEKKRMVDLPGETIGKYRVIERLGRGGKAEVYKVYNLQLDKYMAIKILHPHLVEGKDFQERFKREARAVCNLLHPNIIQVFNFDIKGEIPYMIMDFVEGETLKNRMGELNNKNQVMSFNEIHSIFRQVAEALNYAHQQGLLHGDIKPSNVLIAKFGKAYLTDFRVEGFVSDTKFPASGALLGTPAYMAPEQALAQDIDKTCDIYALGILLYELLTGRVPFDADTPLAVIQKHVSAPLPMPSNVRQDIPESLERIILKSLAKAPEDRYQSVGDMLEETEIVFGDLLGPLI